MKYVDQIQAAPRKKLSWMNIIYNVYLGTKSFISLLLKTKRKRKMAFIQLPGDSIPIILMSACSILQSE